jgi:hypothetical protein
LLAAGWGLAAGCGRTPIGGDDEIISVAASSGEADGEESTGLPPDAGSTGGTNCHPSYEPCLPIVDDLDCPDVVALGAAPVTVIGPDEYRLDRDHDGIGCER